MTTTEPNVPLPDNNQIPTEFKEAKAFKIEDKFDQFRKNDFFIDCIFHIGGKDIKAHRVVLAKRSGYFKEYFQSVPFNPQNLKVDLPFIPPKYDFEPIIEFLYTGDLTFANDSFNILTPDPIKTYMISCFYDIPPLKSIVLNLIYKYLDLAKSEEKVIYKVLLSGLNIYSKYQKYISINNFNVDKYVDLLLEGQSTFTEFICTELISMIDDNPRDLLENISPYMLYLILDYLKNTLPESNFKTNPDIVKFISDYLSFHPGVTFSQKDSSLFEKLIDWGDPKLHLLFARYNLDWVQPSKSRAYLSKVITSRCATIDAMQHRISTQDDMFNNSWNIISWISMVNDSDGETQPKEVELIHFMGTIGGVLTKPINPVKYQFIELNNMDYVKLSPAETDKDPLTTQKMRDRYNPMNSFYPLDKHLDKYYLNVNWTKNNKEMELTIRNAVFNLDAVRLILYPNILPPKEIVMEASIGLTPVIKSKKLTNEEMENFPSRVAVIKQKKENYVNKVDIKMTPVDNNITSFALQRMQLWGKF